MHGSDVVADRVAVHPRTLVGRRLARLRVRLHRRRLDAALAAGRSPWESPDLWIRAARLTSIEERRKVALALRTLVTCAERNRTELAYLQIRGRAVLRAREELTLLADRVGGPEPVPAGVVAQLEWLAWNERSPVFVGGEPAEVLDRITEQCLSATL